MQLEGNLVRELALGQSPARLKVLRQRILLFDSFQNRLVHILLLCRLRLRVRSFRFGLALLEELGFGGGFGALGLLGEECIVNLLSNLVTIERCQLVG